MTRTDISFSLRLKKKQYFTAATMIIGDQSLLYDAMQQFFTGEWRQNQKIANTLQYVKKRKKEEILLPYYLEWLEKLENPPHAAFERNSFRYFQSVFIPDEYRGTLYDLAFAVIVNQNKAIAIRAFAMGVCANIANHYPELVPELKEAIAIAKETKSAGIQAKATNVLLRLNKIKDKK